MCYLREALFQEDLRAARRPVPDQPSGGLCERTTQIRDAVQALETGSPQERVRFNGRFESTVAPSYGCSTRPAGWHTGSPSGIGADTTMNRRKEDSGFSSRPWRRTGTVLTRLRMLRVRSSRGMT